MPDKPGNLLYQVLRTDEQATTLFVRERWATREDADRHIASLAADEIWAGTSS